MVLTASDHPPAADNALAEAAEKAGKYEWMAAAEAYTTALDGLEPLEAGRITELVAKSYFKAAFQSETRERFKMTMQLAEASYETAGRLYEKAGSEALSKRLMARALFATFWIIEGAEERRSAIEKCISTAMEAGRIFESQGEKGRLAEAHKDLLAYLDESMRLAREGKMLKEQFEKALQVVEKAVVELEVAGDNEGLLECLHIAVGLFSYEEILEPARYKELAKKAEGLERRVAEISAKIRTPYALSLAKSAAREIAWNEGDFDKALNLDQARVSAAEATKDSYLIGLSLADNLNSSFWAAVNHEDVERRRQLLEKGLQLASKAINNFDVSFYGPWLAGVYDQSADCYNLLANFVETEPEKKRSHFRKAIEIARRGIIYKDYTWGGTGHALSKAMYFLATMEGDPQERAQLLNEALQIREEVVRETDLLRPRSWNAGVMHNYLALIKAELSNLNPSSARKVELLQGAVFDMQQCVEICKEGIEKNPIYLPSLAMYEEWYGDILLQIYRLTSDSDSALRAVKVYKDAIANLSKVGHVGGIPPVRWKVARVNDTMCDYKAASQVFRMAAEDYRLAAKKVAGSAPVFVELASYMEAWSMIEEARVHHNEEQNLLAAESYSKASSLLNTTRAWGHLSKHYAACSFLEGGEALSRQERQEASIEAFNVASKTFQEAKAEMESRLKKGHGSQENRELGDWLDVTDGRQRYCLGRIELEEAKILDRKGEEEASGAKYRYASEIFRALGTGEKNEQSRRELETLVLFCDAWEKMKEAETRASPQLYIEAADSFTKVEEVATRKRFRLLALANASICRALESGTRFRRTRDTQLYSHTKKQLETAADYYQEAGFQNAADWTHATQRLFDALTYMASAEAEMDSRKKTEFFHLAEKHLQLAAKTYDQAGFQTKREESLRHLKRAREAKELLLTPMEALAQNPALTGVVVTPVSLNRDQAVGLERFEAANVVGNLSLPQGELSVGSELTLELEMANVGKTAAMLIKLENIAPEGLELDRQKVPYRIEDNYLDMKGKRLEHLKTHEVKIPMKPLHKGTFELRPRILFVDEKGNYRSYEFEPASVTVREFGISGWLKGPK